MLLFARTTARRAAALSCILSCALLTLSQPLLAAPRAKSKPPSLSSAWGDLRNGRFTIGGQRCAQVKTDLPLERGWIAVCRALTAMARNEHKVARSYFDDVPQRSAASLFMRTFEAELTAITSPAKGRALAKELTELARSHGIPDLEGHLQLVEGRALVAEKQYRSAIDHYQAVRIRYPRSIAAQRATLLQSRLLQQQPKAIGENVARYWIRELEALLANGETKQAVEAARTSKSKLSKTPMSDVERRELTTLRWRAFRAAGQRAEAERERDQEIKSQTSPWHRAAIAAAARDAWAASKYDQARTLATRLSERDPERAFVLGRSAESEGDLTKARAIYAAVLADPANRYRASLGYRLFLLELFEKRWERALEIGEALEQLSASLAADELEALRFWIAVARAHGVITAASTLPSPGSYYFWLAERGSLRPTAARANLVLRSCRIPEVLPARATQDEARALHQRGLTDFAVMELRYSLPPRSSLAVTIGRARQLAALAGHPPAWRELVRYQSIPSGVRSECGREYAEVLYPRPFADLIKRESTRHQLPTSLVFGLIRTESAFEPRAQSAVGARGLMQLMPATARREGLAKSAPVTKLFEPEVNVPLGTKHLKNVLREFGGEWHLAIGSYNAGAQAVRRWIERYPDPQAEVFVELVPYQETRDYIKKVLTAHWMYELLEDS